MPQASPLTLGSPPLLSLKGQNEVDVFGQRQISRPGRAEAGDKRIRLGWKVSWFWSGFVGGGGALGRRGGGVEDGPTQSEGTPGCGNSSSRGVVVRTAKCGASQA